MRMAIRMFRTYGLRLIVSTMFGFIVSAIVYGNRLGLDIEGFWLWVLAILCGIITTVGIYIWYGYWIKEF
jgi:hypothetical protein